METYSEYLAHHGILGMKLGKRNGPPYPLGEEDHSASEKKAGYKKSIDGSGLKNASANKIRRKLKKEIRAKRAEYLGNKSRRWEVNRPIGPESEKVIEKDKENFNKYVNSESYKKWEREYDRFEKDAEKKIENGSMTFDEYDKKQAELWKKRPKQNYNTLNFVITYSNNGKQYLNDYLEKGGKDLSMAYLKDLGYSEAAAKYFVERMLKKHVTLGDV